MIPDLDIGQGAAALHVRFRSFDGRVEAGLAEAGGAAEARAAWLVGRLAEEIRRGVETVGVEALTISEFDAVLAHLQRVLVAERPACQARCRACGEAFEFALDLAAMQAALAREAGVVPVADGIATDPASGRRFRLPLVKDLPRLRTEGAGAWLRALLVEGPFAPEMEAEIARAAPVLTQDIQAACPECGAANEVRFDIARYLVQSLSGDAGFLWREVHLIARAYGWPLSEILALGRDVRRRLAGFVIADSTGLRRAS